MKQNSVTSAKNKLSSKVEEGILGSSKTQSTKTPKTVETTDSSKGLSERGSDKMSKEDIFCFCTDEPEAPPSIPTASLTAEVPAFSTEKVEQLLKENEEKLRKEFEEQIEKEVNNLKDKFDIMLHNEQVRSSLMLCEAHRERKEKIRALENQLESKNLTGLMYVLCAERRKSKVEKLRLTQEYTSYILALQGILAEAQSLILRLSRGYKTATRLDQEWRDKMRTVVKEFQNFVCHYEGGPPDMHQYLFDVPNLMQVEASTEDDMLEDSGPDDQVEAEAEAEEEQDYEDQPWYKRLDTKDRPFVVYGDLSEFTAPDRREVLKKLKNANTDEMKVPKKWKEYAFNEMFVKAVCPNIDAIKDEYLQYLPTDKWECQAGRTPELTSTESSRHRIQSIDMKGNNMGSILRIISSSVAKKPTTKTMLLGAKDSMEIASSTKLLKERNASIKSHQDPESVILDVRNRKISLFQDISEDDSIVSSGVGAEQGEEKYEEEMNLGSKVHDSLSIHHKHAPVDATINFEKTCPVEACQKLKVDSFVRSLPPYMRASPFLHFEQNFDDYQCCSPEQLALLIRRIAEKKRVSIESATQEDVLAEWVVETPGVYTQTGEGDDRSDPDLPPCTCRDPTAEGMIHNLIDMFPMKHTLDHIEQECLHNDNINFNRFKVLGQKNNGNEETCGPKDDVKFKENRLDEIKKILLKYPDLMDIFQSTPKC